MAFKKEHGVQTFRYLHQELTKKSGGNLSKDQITSGKQVHI